MPMKIITYGKDKKVISQIEEILKQLPIKHKLNSFDKFKYFSEVYKEKNFDFIIVDIDSISTKKMQKVFDYIYAINKNQKIIKVSNTFKCSGLYCCKFCKKEYNNITLIKPISSQDLIYALSQVYCCWSINKSLQRKIKKIESRFDNFQYDIISGIFINKNSFLNGRDENINKITKYLTKEDISLKWII